MAHGKSVLERNTTMKKTIVLVCILFNFALLFSEDNQPMYPLLPAILNTFPGFALGSSIQGDLAATRTIAITDGISAGVCSVGVLVFGVGLLETIFVKMGASDSPDDTKKSYYAEIQSVLNTGEGILISGACLFGISKIIGIVLPIIYYNEGMKKVIVDTRKSNKNYNFVFNGISIIKIAL
jgi:hypothetical protein